MNKRPYGGYFFSQDFKAFHILVKMNDVPGALSTVLTLLHDVVDLVEGASYNLDNGLSVWSGFGKSLSDANTPASIKALLEASPMVVECQVKKSSNGLIADSYHDGLEIAPGRLGIVIPLAGFTRICDHLSKLMGTGGETVLFEEGSVLGQLTGRFLNEQLGSGRLDLRVDAALAMYRASGWGSAKMEVEKNGDQYRVSVTDCLECSSSDSNRKECAFLRGHLLRLVSTLASEEFGIEEGKCRLRGDPHCEFVLLKRGTG